MPSPFPGMDPYLEGSRWPGFHHDLATEIKRQLMPKLRPRYYADTTTYFLLDAEDDVYIAETLYPDVAVVKGNRRGSSAQGAILMTPVKLRLAMPHRVPHFRVEIRDLQKRKLVTCIEFLSPTNKKGDGRKQYLRKRARILRSTAHLLEIDLLRKGRRLPLHDSLPPGSYFVFLSRSEERPEIEVWPIVLNQSLPVVPVPLLKGDQDVELDLQKAVSNVYDLASYDSILSYADVPDAPLSPREAAWANRILKNAGLR